MDAKAKPLISIVIPTYNHAQYINRALQSVFDQTFIYWEVIVVDNHSTDNTAQLVARHSDSRITYMKIHNNGIIAKSRNAGINVAKGEWIAFLDSDDWWTVDKLESVVDSISEKVDLVYHDLKIVNNQPSIFSRKNIRSRQVEMPALANLLLKGNCIWNSSAVVRKSLLQQIGGINESVAVIGAEDYNTWLRIAQITENFFYLSRHLGFYLIHNQGVSQKDMSVPARYAVADFVALLSSSEKRLLEANLRYSSGRFNFLAGNYIEAQSHLLFGLKQGLKGIKIRSAVLLFMCFCKKILA